MSANIWTPQAPAIITPWKWLANFATAGKGVVTDTGKRGVGSGGKAKAFDSAGECAECCGAAVPCTDCDPGGSGNAPNDGAATGMSGTSEGFDCTELNSEYDYVTFRDTTNYCEWEWLEDGSDFFRGGWAYVRLRYVKVSHTSACAGLSVVPEEWYIQYEFNPIVPLGTWEEKTAGFACTPATGKVSGTHAFANANPDCDDDTDCQGPPTFTVLP